MVRWNADARVADPNTNLRFIGAPLDLDLPALWRELDGVGEQVEHDLLDLGVIATGDEGGCWGLTSVSKALRLDKRLRDLFDARDHIVHRDVAYLVRNAAAA